MQGRGLPVTIFLHCESGAVATAVAAGFLAVTGEAEPAAAAERVRAATEGKLVCRVAEAQRVAELALDESLVLWCSAGNSGAAEAAQELVSSMASGGAALRVVDSQPVQASGVSAFMLLYLNDKTWVEQGDVLERDVRTAREGQSGLKIVMVHENDPKKGGCDFGLMFSTTPQELIDGGIYRSHLNYSPA